MIKVTHSTFKKKNICTYLLCYSSRNSKKWWVILKNYCGEWLKGSQMCVWIKQQLSWRFKKTVFWSRLCSVHWLWSQERHTEVCLMSLGSWWSKATKTPGWRKEKSWSRGHRLFTVCGRLAAERGVETKRKKKRVETTTKKISKPGVRTKRASGCGQEVPPLCDVLTAAQKQVASRCKGHTYSNTTGALVVVCTRQIQSLGRRTNTTDPCIPLPGDILASSVPTAHCCDPCAGEHHSDYTTGAE